MRDQNVFRNLVRIEDDFTNLLCNIAQFPEAASVLSEAFGIRPFLAERIGVHYVTGGDGVPDILYDDDYNLVIIEVKVSISRGLTKNQPDHYLRFLSGQTERKTALIFLLPAGYRHKEAIERRYLKLQRLYRTVGMKILYWEDLIISLSRNSSGNRVISDFLKLLSEQFEYEEVFMNSIEAKLLDGNVLPSIYKKLRSTVNFARSEVARSGRYHTEFEAAKNEFGYHVIDPKGRRLFWFGIFEDLWMAKGHALVACANSDFALYKKIRESDDHRFGGWRFLAFKLDAQKSDLSAQFSSFIRKVVKMCA